MRTKCSVNIHRGLANEAKMLPLRKDAHFVP